jgi:hypothetical protein
VVHAVLHDIGAMALGCDQEAEPLGLSVPIERALGRFAVGVDGCGLGDERRRQLDLHGKPP